MRVVHRRETVDGGVAWISDLTRPFAVVLFVPDATDLDVDVVVAAAEGAKAGVSINKELQKEDFKAR